MIRVAVVAIGEMPAAHFRDYVAMLVQHTKIPLSSVSAYYTEHQKSPFSQQPWETGSLMLKFMVGGASRSPWEDFQAHRKILGVIGLCHCPLTPEISAAYEQFLTICKAYPSAQVTRCFAFHPADAQIEVDDEKKKEFLVMFPSMDRQELKVHMQTLMKDFAASLLMAFESWVLHLKPVGLTTPLDSQVSLNSDEVNKKRKLGRVQKTMGDYCLLAGSPLDANSHYYTAIELARLTGDNLWQAGAIEGYVCATVLNQNGHKDYLLEQEVQYRYLEVIQLYRRATALSFELEATLKLARFLCRKELAKDVVELVSGAVEWSKSLMDASDRLVVNVEAARIFAAIGYDRKAAFYGRQVALLYQQQHSHWAAVSALQVMSLTAESYKCLSKAEGREKQVGEWSTLQVDVLYDMLSAAVRAGDALAAWNAAARLLRNHYPLIPPSSQLTLETALSMSAERLAPGTRSSEPAIPFVRLHSYTAMPADREIVKRTATKDEWWMGRTSTGPFIYTPFTAKGDVNTRIPVTWVVGEPVEVLVELANPCVFEVTVESIALSVEHNQFEAFPVSVTLPASSGQVVSLSGLPLAVGSLTVRGCIVKCYGVVTEHLFEEVSEWGSVKGTALVDPFRSGHKVRQPAQYEKVEVVLPLPLLVARAVGGEGAAVLYEGEIREMQISLSNAGVVPVVEAHMTLTGKQQQHVMSIGHTVLEDALPLPPGATVVVPVTLKAGAPTADLDFRNLVRTAKDASTPMLVIHYAGPSLMEGAEAPPGRRVALPLQLHVLKGLALVQAKLLSMEVAANISSSLSDPIAHESEESLVKMDPYRGSWGMRLLELELWNATDVLFEIVVTRKEADEGGRLAEDSECLYPPTRIDRDYAARVLIPLERFKLAGLDKASLARASIRKESMLKDDAKSKDGAERQAKAELNTAIEELSSKICVRWTSGRNSAGELPIKDALREALKASVLKILLPDPLTFGFRLAKTSITAPTLKSARDSGDLDNLPGSPRVGLQKVEADDGGLSADNKGGIGVRELAPIEMLVRNNTNEAINMTLSVTCRDVTGTSCLGSTGSKATVLWAGTLDGVNVEVGALGEVVHRFALCFLVPGQYTLLGSAVIDSQPASETLNYTGPPFAVHVVETS